MGDPPPDTWLLHRRLYLFIAAGLLVAATITALRLPAHPGPVPDSQYRIRINHADEQELQLLPGIGAKTAADIVENRQRDGAFQVADDLQRINGIGPKTVEKISPYLAFD